MAFSAANPSRRSVLAGACAMTGGLLLGVPGTLAAGGKKHSGDITTWIRMAPDETVTIQFVKAEMGQGIHTAMTMIIAEELGVAWDRIVVETAPTAPLEKNPAPEPGMRATGGSTAVRFNYKFHALAGATAREMLKQAAAKRWGIPVSQCVVANGHVVNGRGESLSYGTLAEDASRETLEAEPSLRAFGDWQMLGKPLPRKDTPAKVDGNAVFGIDVDVPEMLIGAIRHCPTMGGTLKSLDDRRAMRMKGVKAVIKREASFIVVADSYWRATKAADALAPEWDHGPQAGLTDASYLDYLKSTLSAPTIRVLNEGEPTFSDESYEAEFVLPFLAHATMEPMNATAMVDFEHAELWVPTQSPDSLQLELSERLGLDRNLINVNTTFLGGGFGRRAEKDFVYPAIEASLATGKPVKVIWSREEDMQHDFYRPMAYARVKAQLDRRGMISDWHMEHTSASPTARLLPRFIQDDVDIFAIEGAADLPYAIPKKTMDYVMARPDVPVGPWRSVGHSLNEFIVETVIDELAISRDEDPAEFRRRHLKDQPLWLAVLDDVIAKSGWHTPAPQGRYRGLAIGKPFGSIVAQVVELSVENETDVHLHKITASVDCGWAVNPNTIDAQLQSGIIYALTAAAFGEITLTNGKIDQDNFDSYEMTHIEHIPEINVSILESRQEMGGIGEVGTPALFPALTNALYAATGKRLRSLPISKHGFTLSTRKSFD